jgi:hypothetical protein
MQEDIHFYGVYALARAAGIDPETAKTIGYASQFVDDAIDDETIVLDNQKAILPTITSHKPIDYENAIPGDQWRVWIPFHFLPGNDPGSTTFIERMVCRKDSDPARRMLTHALHSSNSAYWPHLIGIAAHVYADTFSHFGFVGIAHQWNKVKGDSIEASEEHSPSILDYIQNKFEDFKMRFAGGFAEMIPVGHGSVASYPDRPYLKWRFEYEDGNHTREEMVRDNVVHFMDGCRGLYGFFHDFSRIYLDGRDLGGNRAWKDVKDQVECILRREDPLEERIGAWKEAISAGHFCEATQVDREISYDPDLWRPCAIGEEFPEKCDANRFFMAAWFHRNYVLQDLLHNIGILI